VPPHALLSRARLVGVAALVVAATCVTSANGAKAATVNPASLTAHERQVLYELYADDTAIARARTAADRVTAQVAGIDRRLAHARLEASLARRALHSAQSRLALRLAAWYREGSPPDAVEIFLGARSLSSAIDQVKLWHSATRMDRSVIVQTTAARALYRTATRSLASARATAQTQHDALIAQIRELEGARAAKAALLASLRREARAGQARAAARRRLVVLVHRAQRATRRSAAGAAHSSRAAGAGALGRLADGRVDRLRAARHDGDRPPCGPGCLRRRSVGDPARHALRRAGVRELPGRGHRFGDRRQPDRRLGGDRGRRGCLGPARRHDHLPVTFTLRQARPVACRL
jgi:septal ring factor EnvC (AmiA/AmiB activator)